MSEELLKEALEKIDSMNFPAGRGSTLGLEIREVIRKAFHPDEPCPQCKGAGEVPQIREFDHGDCKKWESRGPYNGWCKHFQENRDEMAKDVCYKFDPRLPMQKCPSCKGDNS